MCAYTTSVTAEIVLDIGTSRSPTISIDYAAVPALAAMPPATASNSRRFG